MKVYKANSKKKFSALTICLLLTVVMVVGGTLAYIYTNTNAVTNTFKPAQAPNNIEETMNTDKTVKSNVAISVPSLTENPEAVDVYIRVALVASWQDEKGNIAPKVPVPGTDYTVVMGDSSKWKQPSGSEYYYYTAIVKPGQTTDILFKSITVKSGNEPDGYTLHIELLSQSIQAEGVDKNGVKPVVLAWGVDPSTLK